MLVVPSYPYQILPNQSRKLKVNDFIELAGKHNITSPLLRGHVQQTFRNDLRYCHLDIMDAVVHDSVNFRHAQMSNRLAKALADTFGGPSHLLDQWSSRPVSATSTVCGWSRCGRLRVFPSVMFCVHRSTIPVGATHPPSRPPWSSPWCCARRCAVRKCCHCPLLGLM